MKFDMGAAWNTATSLIGKNRDMILVVAGVFFFLPYLAATLLAPRAISPEISDPENLDALIAVMQQTYADFWWVLLSIFISQGIGTLALLVLLTDRTRPTLGEAIKRGAISFPSYFVTNILVAIVGASAILVPVGLSLAGGSTAVTVVAVMLALPLVLYLMVKFSLTTPAIAVDGILDPLAAMARSWRLTKGNSFPVFLFYVLLLVATSVVAMLVTMMLGVVFAALGGEVQQIGNGIAASLVNAAAVVIFLAVLAGVHRQLSGG